MRRSQAARTQSSRRYLCTESRLLSQLTSRRLFLLGLSWLTWHSSWAKSALAANRRAFGQPGIVFALYVLAQNTNEGVASTVLP